MSRLTLIPDGSKFNNDSQTSMYSSIPSTNFEQEKPWRTKSYQLAKDGSVIVVDRSERKEQAKQPKPKENKSFSESLRERFRRCNARVYQHLYFQPFTIKVDLIILDQWTDSAHANFRRKLSRLRPANLHSDWSLETCKTQTQSHYHALIRTDLPIEDVEQYLTDCISHRKGQAPRTRFELNVEEIDQSRAKGAIIYASKASYKLLKKIKPDEKYKRTSFSNGQPFAFPVRKLAQMAWLDHLNRTDPDRLLQVCPDDQWTEFLQSKTENSVEGKVYENSIVQLSKSREDQISETCPDDQWTAYLQGKTEEEKKTDPEENSEPVEPANEWTEFFNSSLSQESELLPDEPDCIVEFSIDSS